MLQIDLVVFIDLFISQRLFLVELLSNLVVGVKVEVDSGKGREVLNHREV